MWGKHSKQYGSRTGPTRANVPRKGGPGITRSDLLVINKIDLAHFVGADLKIMESDSKRMRGKKPFYFTNLKENQGVEKIADFIVKLGGLKI